MFSQRETPKGYGSYISLQVEFQIVLLSTHPRPLKGGTSYVRSTFYISLNKKAAFKLSLINKKILTQGLTRMSVRHMFKIRQIGAKNTSIQHPLVTLGL